MPDTITSVPLNKLIEHHDNVRTEYDDAKLEELAQSILDRGVLQPLRVHGGQDGTYQVIAGHRRIRALLKLKAAKKIKASHPVPVLFAGKSVSDSEATLDMLVENLQREDISAIDEAGGFNRMVQDYSFTQRELAAKIGKSPGHIAKRIALLSLPIELQAMVQHQLEIDVAYRISKLDDDQITKIAKGFESGKFTANNIAYDVMSKEQTLVSRRCKEAFEKELAKLMLEPLKELPEGDYERVGSYLAGSLDGYVPRKTHTIVLQSYSNGINVFRKLTPKQLEAKRVKQEQELAERIKEEAKAEAEWLEKEAEPGEVWDHKSAEIMETWRSDSHAYAQAADGALGEYLLNLDSKMVRQLTATRVLEAVANMRNSDARRPCEVLGLNPPEFTDDGEAINTWQRAWGETMDTYIDGDDVKALRCWVAAQSTANTVPFSDAYQPLRDQLEANGHELPVRPDVEAILGARPGDEDDIEDEANEAAVEQLDASTF